MERVFCFLLLVGILLFGIGFIRKRLKKKDEYFAMITSYIFMVGYFLILPESMIILSNDAVTPILIPVILIPVSHVPEILVIIGFLSMSIGLLSRIVRLRKKNFLHITIDGDKENIELNDEMAEQIRKMIKEGKISKNNESESDENKQEGIQQHTGNSTEA